jgi:hypothetical protein
MHNSIEVLFYFFDIFFRSHESFHKDVELFVQSDDFDSSVTTAIIIEHLLCAVEVFIFFVEAVYVGEVVCIAVGI